MNYANSVFLPGSDYNRIRPPKVQRIPSEKFEMTCFAEL